IQSVGAAFVKAIAGGQVSDGEDSVALMLKNKARVILFDHSLELGTEHMQDANERHNVTIVLGFPNVPGKSVKICIERDRRGLFTVPFAQLVEVDQYLSFADLHISQRENVPVFLSLFLKL